MTFEKYPSIDDCEKQKTVQRFLSQYPELIGAECHIQEKIDGSNIQIYANGMHDVKLGKRSGFLSPDENFQGIWGAFELHKHELFMLLEDLASKYVDDYPEDAEVRLYGELFGSGIQNRVDYGDGQWIIIFDAIVNGQFVPYDTLKEIGGGQVVASYGTTTFEEANKVEVENLVSHYSPSGDYAEGVVVKPKYPYVDKGSGSLIALKNKANKFSEKENKHKKKPKSENTVQMSEKGQYLKQEFDSLINENRVLSVFSKHGPIEDESQIGSYIKLVLEDVKEDFFKDFGEDFKVLDDKEKKLFFKSAGSLIVPHLKKHL